MDNNRRVGELLGSLTSLSAGQARILERLQQCNLVATASDANQEDVKILVEFQKQSQQMRERIAELTEELDAANDVTATDAELSQFRVSFAGRVKGVQTTMLFSAYDIGYFLSQPRTLRPIIADVLIELVGERKVAPLPLWQRVSNSGGAL